MTAYELLENEASDIGIDILTEEIPVPGMTAAYVRKPSGAPIIILAPACCVERTCGLAEELGHHHTGTDHVLHYDSVLDWKAEAHARKWAHDRLLTPEAIRIAARNATDIYDLADALGVTESFLREAVDDYMVRGLWAI